MTDLVPDELMAIMQCPSCGGSLDQRTDPPALVCRDCGLAYPVNDGIPSMIVEEATQTKEDGRT